jgi:murein DD-endopeptidase MepM/ murein hydrolase activator NlpD
MVAGQVQQGQSIGQADNSGNAAGTATHLHFAIARDPSVFTARNGSGNQAGDDSSWWVYAA